MCDYIAKRDVPKTWNGNNPRNWGLKRSEDYSRREIKKWRCPHPSIEGKDRCIFHTKPDDLPEDIDESKALLNALNEAGESPFEDGPEHRGQFVGATFGALDLSGETIVADDHDVRFDHAKICSRGEDILFDDTKFVTRQNRLVSFQEVSFITENKNDINFHDASFIAEGEGDVRFSGAEFTTKGEGNVIFNVTTFTTKDDGYVLFNSAEFIAEGNGSVRFDSAEFTTEGEGDVWFDLSEFTTKGEGNVSFNSAKFKTEGKGDVRFSSVVFTNKGSGSVSFQLAEFTTKREGSVMFDSVDFTTEGGGYVLFKLAEFTTKGDGSVEFRSAKFVNEGSGGVLFIRSNFTTEGDGNIIFSEATFSNSGSGSTSFRDAKFGEFRNHSPQSYNISHLRNNYERTFFRTGTGDIQFDRVTFDSEKTQEFRGVEFVEETDFTETIFDCPVLLGNWFVNTNARVSFSNAEFIEPCQFGSSNGVTKFQGILDFSGARFHKQVDFEGKALNTANPGSAESNSSDEFDVKFSGHVSFKNTTLPEGSDLNNTKFSDGTDFSGANLTGVNFRQSDLSKANLERAKLNRAELLGTNLIGSRLYGVLLGDVRINHQTSFWPTTNISFKNALLWENPIPGGGFKLWKGWLRQGSIPYCCYDPRYDSIDTLPSYHEMNGFEEADGMFRLEKAAEVYGTIESAARDNSLSRVASEAFVGRKDVQRKQYYRDDDQGRQSLLYVRSFVPNMIARYGESPWRVLGFGALTITGFGLLYWALELIERQDTGAPATILESMYFSSLTFTTLGYGDFRPVNTVGQISAVLETAIGVIVLAILVFVFGRRATR